MIFAGLCLSQGACARILRMPNMWSLAYYNRFCVYVWTCKYDFFQIRRKKNLRFRKYPDMWGRSLSFQDVLCPHKSPKSELTNSSGSKSVLEKLRFHVGLVWTVGLTLEIKQSFRDGLVWTVGLTVEIKLRFDVGLVGTVGLTVEIKLCFKLSFRDGLVWTVDLTVEIKQSFRDDGLK